MADLKLLYDAILTGKHKIAAEITQVAIEEKLEPKELIDNYLIMAIVEIGDWSEIQQSVGPELLMACRSMKASLS